MLNSQQNAQIKISVLGHSCGFHLQFSVVKISITMTNLKF